MRCGGYPRRRVGGGRKQEEKSAVACDIEEEPFGVSNNIGCVDLGGSRPGQEEFGVGTFGKVKANSCESVGMTLGLIAWVHC